MRKLFLIVTALSMCTTINIFSKQQTATSVAEPSHYTFLCQSEGNPFFQPTFHQIPIPTRNEVCAKMLIIIGDTTLSFPDGATYTCTNNEHPGIEHTYTCQIYTGNQ